MWVGRRHAKMGGRSRAREERIKQEKGSIASTSFPGRDKRPGRRRWGLRAKTGRQRQDQEHCLPLLPSSRPHHLCTRDQHHPRNIVLNARARRVQREGEREYRWVRDRAGTVDCGHTFGLYSAFLACRAIVLRSSRHSKLTVATIFLHSSVILIQSRFHRHPPDLSSWTPSPTLEPALTGAKYHHNPDEDLDLLESRN
jgi:hypothetical protein